MSRLYEELREEIKEEIGVRIAIRMLRDNIPVEKIAQYTGLSVKKIEKIKEEDIND